MACLPKIGLTAVVLLALAAPSAGATTIVDTVGGAGPEAGEAIGVSGDRRANDITITRTRVSSHGRIRAAFKIVDRRSRVRSRLPGCRAYRRHTVTCPFLRTSFFYIHLGAGNDRFDVKGFESIAKPVVSAPDGLAAFPQDEGSGGSFLGWIIDGGAGDDRIFGSPYFDHIVGGPGSDELYGRGGDDLFEQRGEPGEDQIFGGTGHNALQWNATTALSIDLRQDTFNGGRVQSLDKVRGGAGDDVLIGSDRPEMLQGGGGADAIAGLGGADLLIGDGLFTLNPGSDRIDGGPGDDLIDISNRAHQPYGSGVDRTSQGPADVVSCADGNDRVDTFNTQLVPVDCEGARFNDAATTVPLRPVARPDGTLVFDLPCPAQSFYPRPIGTCDGTLTLTDPADRRVLGSAAFSAHGGARAAVTVKPAPSPAGRPIAVRITGAFDHANASDSINQFDFGWATTF